MNKSRTDMAMEAVTTDFKYDVDRVIYGIELKKLVVDAALSKKIHKNKGVYYSLDKIDYYQKEAELVRTLSGVIKDIVLGLDLPEKASILVVGLGNTMITPDSLGPLTINKIEVNRHLEEDYTYQVSAIAPGVMGQTGMESSEIIEAIVDDFKPNLVLVVDALACSNPDRMCRSIQLSTAGINPGSGIGNHRREFSKKTLEVDVVAIGIPTVCDIDVFSTEVENDFFVTPNNIDQAMDILSSIVAKGINKAFVS